MVWPISSTAAAHEREHLGAGTRVEVAGRLVGEDDLRPAGQGPRHGHPLLLAAGELARPVPQPVGAAPSCSTTWSSQAWSAFRPASAEGQGDVLDRGQRRDQVVGLEHEADVVAAQQGQRLVVEAC